MASSFLNQFLTEMGGDNVRDYQHAARTFVDGLYRLSPKMQSLFHVFIDVNPTLYRNDPYNPNSLYEIGVLAKTAQLPKFTIQNKVYNAYNRKNIVQERINYDPITMTFHDDSANTIRNFWAGYYGYYYRDSDHSAELYNQDYKYVPRQEKNWGYSPDYAGSGAPSYINSIRIYSLSQKDFSSYILFRPTITAFQHGQHQQGEYAPLEHSMTFTYEAVQYEYGTVSNGTVTGFDVMHYDKTTSPIGGSVGGLTNLNSIIRSATNTVKNIQNGSIPGAINGAMNVLSAVQGTGPITGLIPTSAIDLQRIGTNILKGQNNQSPVFIPTASSIQNGLATATSAISGSVTKVPGATSLLNINSQNLIPPAINTSLLGNFGL